MNEVLILQNNTVLRRETFATFAKGEAGITLKGIEMNALDKQVEGNHYKDLPIQPIEYIHANAMGYMEGNVVKYVSRWRKKNGIADLEKAKHYIELLIELENRRARKTD
jgi:hypothetical protein